MRDEGEFDAFAHRIDPFGAHADFIAVVPFELAWLCAAATTGAARSAATPTGQGHDSVIALAKHASRAGEFFQRPDGKKALHEDFEKLDKTAVFLHGNDQPVVFLAEMLLHELSGFPVHQFALGAVGALEEFAGTRCVLRERDHAIVALPSGSGRGAPGARRSRGAKPRQLEWHLGDKVRVRAERIDPMRKRVEFALVEKN